MSEAIRFGLVLLGLVACLVAALYLVITTVRRSPRLRAAFLLDEEAPR